MIPLIQKQKEKSLDMIFLKPFSIYTDTQCSGRESFKILKITPLHTEIPAQAKQNDNMIHEIQLVPLKFDQ